MKQSLRYSQRARVFDVRQTARRQQPLATEAGPTPDSPGEVLVEIGLILAVHLAVALAVTLTLRAFGIA